MYKLLFYSGMFWLLCITECKVKVNFETMMETIMKDDNMTNIKNLLEKYPECNSKIDEVKDIECAKYLIEQINQWTNKYQNMETEEEPTITMCCFAWRSLECFNKFVLPLSECKPLKSDFEKNYRQELKNLRHKFCDPEKYCIEKQTSKIENNGANGTSIQLLLGSIVFVIGIVFQKLAL